MQFVLMIIPFIVLEEVQAWKGNFFVPTRLDCQGNPEYFSNYSCVLKPISRFKKIARIHVDIKKPIWNMFINVQVYKRFNGWRPFMYNISYDLCDFLKDRNTNYFLRLSSPIIDKYTNLNHSCPYNSTFELRDFNVNDFDIPEAHRTIAPSGSYKGVLVIHDLHKVYLGTIIGQATVKELS